VSGDRVTLAFAIDPGAQWRQVVLACGILDVSQEFGAFTGQVPAPAQQVARGAHALGIDVGLREHAAAEQDGDLAGIELIVLGLAAVDGLHIQGVSEHEMNTLLGTQIGEPVPGEDALDADHEVFSERRDGAEERLGRGLHIAVQEDLAVTVQDAQIHGSGVQVDAAVVLVGVCVESHWGLLSRRLSE
jgi:hypothetical protein